jgi:hypothetical protein
MGTSTKLFEEALISVVHDLSDYWPLTVRQVYYQLVAHHGLPNKQSQYRRVSRVSTKLRRADRLPWESIEDRTRKTIDKRGVDDVRAFVAGQMETLLDWRYYHRCRVQNQDVYVEVATEKDALASILEEVVWPYCVRLNVVRGQVSATMVNQMAARFAGAAERGQRPVLIYLGDLDPSGVAIPKALARNMAEHHGVEVEVIRAALNPDDIDWYNLPVSFEAAKTTDPNYRTWLEEYGDQRPVELDALHPADLSDLVKAELETAIDMTDFEEQMAIEERERAQLKQAKRDVTAFLRREHPDLMAGY